MTISLSYDHFKATKDKGYLIPGKKGESNKHLQSLFTIFVPKIEGTIRTSSCKSMKNLKQPT